MGMPSDSDLVATAEAVLREQYEPGRHHTAAALRTASGETYTGISLKARTGVADVHAEPIAVARAALDGHRDLDTVVAVQPSSADAWQSQSASGDTRIVSACGHCRELLLAFAPDLRILLSGDDGPERQRLADVASGV